MYAGKTVVEIREMLQVASADEFDALERSLEADTRKGVRKAVEVRRRQLEAERAERARLEGLYEFDRAFRGRGKDGIVVGLDEVGRGAVAGPLAVGAVALPDEPMVAQLNDSKQLTPTQRESVAEEIRAVALAWTVFYVDPSAIDTRGMALALREAFAGALVSIRKLGIEAAAVLVDGNPLGIDAREVSVIKGDATSASIAAASIVAKVERDALMMSLSSTFPEYGFIHNKGYASPDHIEAIRRSGLSNVHRASFCRSFMQETLF